jgi:hypothetical protein
MSAPRDKIAPEHDLFQSRLGADYEKFCVAIVAAAKLFARCDPPQLAFSVDVGKGVNVVFVRRVS